PLYPVTTTTWLSNFHAFCSLAPLAGTCHATSVLSGMRSVTSSWSATTTRVGIDGVGGGTMLVMNKVNERFV
ncbi:MAG: hypothetical protein P8Y12_04980, partial [Gammaproteobacteria bacterium]